MLGFESNREHWENLGTTFVAQVFKFNYVDVFKKATVLPENWKGFKRCTGLFYKTELDLCNTEENMLD